MFICMYIPFLYKKTCYLIMWYAILRNIHPSNQNYQSYNFAPSVYSKLKPFNSPDRNPLQRKLLRFCWLDGATTLKLIFIEKFSLFKDV